MQLDWFSIVTGLGLLANVVILGMLSRRARQVPADAPRTWMRPYMVALGILVLVQLTVVIVQWRQPGISSYTRSGVATLALVGGIVVLGLVIRVAWIRYRRRTP